MKIAIIGSGAVGSYFGGRIAHAGHDVTFIARGENLKVLQTKGLKVSSILGDFTLPSVKASDDLKKVEGVDLIILAVKAWQIQEVSRGLKPIINKKTVVLPLQNGVTIHEELCLALNNDNVIGGLCKIICMMDSPGVIRHMGLEPTILFGELDNQKSTRMLRIKELFDSAGITSFIADDIQAELWKKFIVICVSGLLAITRASYGVVREMKETRKIMQELLSEIYAVSLKEKIKLSDDIVTRTMDFIDTFPYNSTSSLTRDVLEGRPSEIEYQNGTVVKLGEKHRLDTPVNRFVYHCILPMEFKARKDHMGK